MTSDPAMDAQAARLTRYNLGGISVEDLMDPQFDPAGSDKDSRREYVARIHGMIDMLRKEVKMAIGVHIDFNARYSENWEQNIFGRGGINGVEVMLERWEALDKEHLQNVEDAKEKTFDKFNPAPETES
jgi:hypothetical protein